MQMVLNAIYHIDDEALLHCIFSDAGTKWYSKIPGQKRIAFFGRPNGVNPNRGVGFRHGNRFFCIG
jgi:hypothetical protein